MVEFAGFKNYEDYIKSQISAGTEKKNAVWVKVSTIDKIVAEENRPIESVICHGVRSGRENTKFAEHATHVVGTEISAESIEFNRNLGRYKNSTVVEWDFNKQNPEWVNKFDLVYSNSLDHAYDPLETLNVWIDQLKDDGTLVIDFAFFSDGGSDLYRSASNWDPYQDTPYSLEEYIPNVFSMKLVYSFYVGGGKGHHSKVMGFKHEIS